MPCRRYQTDPIRIISRYGFAIPTFLFFCKAAIKNIYPITSCCNTPPLYKKVEITATGSWVIHLNLVGVQTSTK